MQRSRYSSVYFMYDSSYTRRRPPLSFKIFFHKINFITYLVIMSRWKNRLNFPETMQKFSIALIKCNYFVYFQYLATKHHHDQMNQQFSILIPSLLFEMLQLCIHFSFFQYLPNPHLYYSNPFFNII